MKVLFKSTQSEKGEHEIYHSSFPVIHKVGNVDIFVLPEFENYER